MGRAPLWIHFSLCFSCNTDFPCGLWSASKYPLSAYCVSDSVLQVEDAAGHKVYRNIY